MRTSLRLLALIAVVAAAAVPGRAGDEPAKGGPPGQPGPIHARLAKLAGEYTTENTFRVNPDDKPVKTAGTATITSVLGGRFLREEGSGTFMGRPNATLKLYGYNDAAGHYESTWVYTGSTGMMALVGTSPDDGKTIEWTGTYDQGKGDKATLYVITRFLDEDHFVVELHAKKPGSGEKGPVLETTYTRKK
jgi:hypothetical protein